MCVLFFKQIRIIKVVWSQKVLTSVNNFLKQVEDSDFAPFFEETTKVQNYLNKFLDKTTLKVYRFHHRFFQFLLSGKSIFKDQYPLSPTHFLDWINKCLGESCLSKRGIKLLKYRNFLNSIRGKLILLTSSDGETIWRFQNFMYSCNNITTTIIQISRLFYFGFFSKTNHQMMI